MCEAYLRPMTQPNQTGTTEQLIRGTCVMPKGTAVAGEGRGESPCWGSTPLGELLPCGIPLGLPCDVVRKAMCWRKLTSSSAIAAAPSLSFCCSAYIDRRDDINTLLLVRQLSEQDLIYAATWEGVHLSLREKI